MAEKKTAKKKPEEAKAETLSHGLTDAELEGMKSIAQENSHMRAEIEALKADLAKRKASSKAEEDLPEDKDFYNLVNTKYPSEQITLPTGQVVKFNGYHSRIPKNDKGKGMYEMLRRTTAFVQGRIKDTKVRGKDVHIGPRVIEGGMTTAIMGDQAKEKSGGR